MRKAPSPTASTASTGSPRTPGRGEDQCQSLDRSPPNRVGDSGFAWCPWLVLPSGLGVAPCSRRAAGSGCGAVVGPGPSGTLDGIPIRARRTRSAAWSWSGPFPHRSQHWHRFGPGWTAGCRAFVELWLSGALDACRSRDPLILPVRWVDFNAPHGFSDSEASLRRGPAHRLARDRRDDVVVAVVMGDGEAVPCRNGGSQ